MRAGTSRGLFLHLRDLPKDRAEWTEVILSAMGSPDCFGRQLDGVGAGTSTTSKVAVVWKSEEAEVDVEYLFIQGEHIGIYVFQGVADTHSLFIAKTISTCQRYDARLLRQLRQHGFWRWPLCSRVSRCCVLEEEYYRLIVPRITVRAS